MPPQVERSNEDLSKQRAKLVGDLASVNQQLEEERRNSAALEKAKRKVYASYRHVGCALCWRRRLTLRTLRSSGLASSAGERCQGPAA